MPDEPQYRQRLLTTIEDIDAMLSEVRHLPGDTLLAVDVIMTDSQHQTWLQHCLDAPGANEPGRDGEEVFAEIRAELKLKAEQSRAKRYRRGCGAPQDIAADIANMQPGSYQYTLERMPTDDEVRDTTSDLNAELRDALRDEFDGKSDVEVTQQLDEWKQSASKHIEAERIRLMRLVAHAQRAGLFSKDEWLLLAVELIRARFGADLADLQDGDD